MDLLVQNLGRDKLSYVFFVKFYFATVKAKHFFELIIKMTLLTLILLELKVISHCRQYRARPVCSSVQSNLGHYTVG